MNHRRFEPVPCHLQGIAVSPGYAIGVAQVIAPHEVHFTKYLLEDRDIENELSRFQVALQISDTQLQEIKDNLSEEESEHHAILEMHQLMLHDNTMVENTIKLIRQEKLNAEWALSQVVNQLRDQFDAIDDAFFRERRADLEHITDRLLRNLQGQQTHFVTRPRDNQTHAILVGRDLSPADTASIDRTVVQGFVTEFGGLTSHTAITARALGLPAVVGVKNLTSRILRGHKLIIDGVSGEIIINPTPEEIADYQALRDQYRARQQRTQESTKERASTQDGVFIKVSGNIALPSEAAELFEKGAQGIGLFRSEFLYMGRNTLPSEEEQTRQYRRILETSGNEGATIRTLDIGGDKLAESIQQAPEANPIMGLRAIRFCLQHPEILRVQLRALWRASPYGNLRILVPMIASLEEVRAFKAILAQCREELIAEGYELPERLPIGIMIELPSAAIIADLLAQEVDFFSIGTNDLIQYTLGVDRVNEQVSSLYRPLHPAILRLIARICQAAQSAQIPVSICGEMAGEIFYIPLLLGLGLRSLSMAASSIPKAKAAIRLLRMSDCEALTQEVLAQKTASDCAQFTSQRLKQMLQALGYPEDLEAAQH